MCLKIINALPATLRQTLYFITVPHLCSCVHISYILSIYTQEASGENTTSLNPLWAHPSVQKDLLEVYGHIGEPDSLYGAIILFSPQEELRRRWYEHEGQWDKALSKSMMHNISLFTTKLKSMSTSESKLYSFSYCWIFTYLSTEKCFHFYLNHYIIKAVSMVLIW